ncbi:MAG: hypothetical protein ILP10_07285 [Lachnospiraceae bacterium]|nr:hypothetical protein [Lachnospiraceae bacterium]
METKEKKTVLLTFVLLALALILIAVGIWRDEIRTVIDKAVRICMECIGIG